MMSNQDLSERIFAATVYHCTVNHKHFKLKQRHYRSNITILSHTALIFSTQSVFSLGNFFSFAKQRKTILEDLTSRQLIADWRQYRKLLE